MQRKAFTLIELIVVVVIISVLATTIIINVGNAQLKSRDARRRSDLDSLKSSFGMYYAENNAYPPGSDLQCNSTENCWSVTSMNLSAYIPSLPIDPKNGINGGMNICNQQNSGFVYLYMAVAEMHANQSIQAQKYVLAAKLEGDVSQDPNRFSGPAPFPGACTAFANYAIIQK